MLSMKKHYFFLGLISLSIFYGYAQKNTRAFAIRTVAFYNVENLFDTINDPNTNDEASPMMELKVNKSKVYWDKIEKLAKVISQIGFDKTKTSPTLIGLAEVENRAVLEDLVKSDYLKKYEYGIVHYNAPDKRGIDVALLYQQRYFKPLYHQNFHPKLYRKGRKIYTRDQLLVSGYLDDEMIHVIVNHWPSRRGGVSKTNLLREKSAYQTTQIIQQIKEENALAKILIMGDFNDDPINSSFKKVLRTKSKKENLEGKDIYNPYENLFKQGYSTSGYRDQVHLFDQILCSATFVAKDDQDFSSYKLFRSKIFNKPFLTNQTGTYKNYPFRSFSYGNYLGGYSDHYPVYVYLIKEK